MPARPCALPEGNGVTVDDGRFDWNWLIAHDMLAASPPRRILVTGSRNWADVHAVVDALEVLDAFCSPHPVTLVHGGAPGADTFADAWARCHSPRWTVEAHPARWATHGVGAGPVRNRQMVQAGADLCLAFIRNRSRGASGCAALAQAVGIPTWFCRAESL